MSRITAAGIGSSRQQDAYHNDFLNTGDMLAQRLKQGMGDRVIVAGETEQGEDRVAERFATSENVFAPNHVLQEHVVIAMNNLKNDMVALFQETSANNGLSVRIEAMIRRLEDIQQSIGVEVDPFDPLRNMSGLQAGEPLENADKVIANTLKHYKAYGISAITSSMGKFGPSIQLSIFGENDGVGFEVDGFVAAREDFNGNEAVDYVWSPEGGLMTVKARHHGTWNDASTDFVIDCKVTRYTLGEQDQNLHSLFLGQKIISEGQEKLLEALKANTEDLKFGKCRVFSTKPSLIAKVADLVRVNKEMR